MPDWILDATAWVIPLATAIILHEVAHGWMAEKFGDNTARLMGRITLNPFRHIDRFGTIVMPALLIIAQSPVVLGYAKPVPVNFNQLHPKSFGSIMVAIAGPGTNIILAIIAALLLHIDSYVTPEQAPWLFQNLTLALTINCVLAVFNMLPLLPLDGGRVIYALLSGSVKRAYGQLERFGLPLLLIALIVPGLFGINMLEEVLSPPVFGLLELIMRITGNQS